MSVKITFVDNFSFLAEQVHPTPAKNVLPDWYRRLQGSHKVDEVVRSPSSKAPGEASTIKKCMPVFDSISAGYILFTPMDLEVYWSEEDGHTFQTPASEFIDFHHPKQIIDHPVYRGDKDLIPKFVNPWSVITPNGYSCMFMTPQHRDLPFELLPAIVDTDKYIGPVTFPFVFKDPTWQGTIKAGTPMAQVIPFKRESYEAEITDSNKLGYSPAEKSSRSLSTRFVNAYKDFFWSKKDFS